MTAQEIFTKVATHLLAQGKPALRGQQCAYRGDGGTSCAVGCLIPDELYEVEMENKLVTSSALSLAVIKLGLAPHLTLLSALQTLHDFEHPDLWAKCLKELATLENLEMP